MSEIEIEKGVPVPQGYGGYRHTRWAGLAESMEVGDSFVLENLAHAQLARTSLSQYKRRTNSARRFTIRKIDAVRYRCWRVE